MYDLLKRFRELFVIFGMTGLFFALFYFGIVRVLDQNREKMISIQQSIVDRKMLEEQRGGLPLMREEVSRIQSAGDRIAVFLPEDRIVSLVETLEMIGRDLGVSVISEASSSGLIVPPTKKKSVKKVAAEEGGVNEKSELSEDEKKTSEEKESVEERIDPLLSAERSIFITFKVTGTYDRVLAFLWKLDTLPVMLDTLSVSIEPILFDENSSEISSSQAGLSIIPRGNTPLEGSVSDTSSVQDEVTASFQTVLYTE